ncbi:MAG TPA: fluoride efflux transporter CrcB [Burkholderiaceae bacterium]|jgi:CrcB protein|nr:fluoride efflux transporter CrcB [Burkholderiaceae bacterium]
MRQGSVWMAFAAVGVGSACGAWLRWWLGLRLNPLFPTVPLGTLASNLIGGYLVGIAVAVFAQNQALAPEWRLLAITGFLGGLTTFSTFSAEVVALLARGQLSWALATAFAHLAGSLGLTALGIATVRSIG